MEPWAAAADNQQQIPPSVPPPQTTRAETRRRDFARDDNSVSIARISTRAAASTAGEPDRLAPLRSQPASAVIPNGVARVLSSLACPDEGRAVGAGARRAAAPTTSEPVHLAPPPTQQASTVIPNEVARVLSSPRCMRARDAVRDLLFLSFLAFAFSFVLGFSSALIRRPA
jgi:hypothetical protein